VLCSGGVGAVGGDDEADHMWSCGGVGACELVPAISGINILHVMHSRSQRFSAPANNLEKRLRPVQQRQRQLQIRMAAREPSRYLARSLPRAILPSARPQSVCFCRNTSDDAASKSPAGDLDELESSSLATAVPKDVVKSFDPVTRAKSRKGQLPRSR